MATTDKAPPTPLSLVSAAAGYFGDKGIESARLDAEVLLAHVLGIERIGLYLQFDKPLHTQEVDRYRDLVRRRAKGEPTAYLTGKREFWSLSFEVGPGILVPRPDTERLVEAALEVMGESGKFLELGVGSGAISVALLTEKPGWTAVGVDLEEAPLDFTLRNGKTHGVGDRLTLCRGDLFAPVSGMKFDLIVSNPPYIPSSDIASLMPDVASFEPRTALDGGPDGLVVIRRIANEAKDFLDEEGVLLVEFGAGQGPDVLACFATAGGYADAGLLNDYAGRERVFRAQKA